MLQYIVTRRFYTKNTMEEQLIQYKTALLAKEKGFNEYCKKEYVETLEHTLACRGGDFTFPHQPPRIIDIGIKESYDKFHAKAPTQSLLQKWLREVHEIEVNPAQNFTKGGIKMQYNISIESYKYNHLGKYIYGNTYEEVLEVGLQEGLKLIK